MFPQSIIRGILNFIGIFAGEQRPPRWPIKRIGVIIWGGIGDSLLFYPALNALRKNFKHANIGVFLQRKTAGIFFENLYDEIYDPFNGKDRKRDWTLPLLKSLKCFKPDVVIANAANPEFFSGFIGYLSGAKYRVGFSSSGRGFFFNLSVKNSHSHEIDRNLRLISLLGVKAQNRKIDIPVVPVPFAKKGKIIGLHSGSGKGMSFKRWPKEKFLKLGKMILDAGHHLVLLGTKEEKEEIEFLKGHLESDKNFIDLTKFNDIRKTAYIVSQLDLLISNDTIIAHLGSASNIPVIVIFGPSDEVRYGPFGSKGQVIKKDVSCRPCRPEVAIRCKNRICLEKIMPEEVFNKAMEMIETVRRKA